MASCGDLPPKHQYIIIPPLSLSIRWFSWVQGDWGHYFLDALIPDWDILLEDDDGAVSEWKHPADASTKPGMTDRQQCARSARLIKAV